MRHRASHCTVALATEPRPARVKPNASMLAQTYATDNKTNGKLYRQKCVSSVSFVAAAFSCFAVVFFFSFLLLFRFTHSNYFALRSVTQHGQILHLMPHVRQPRPNGDQTSTIASSQPFHFDMVKTTFWKKPKRKNGKQTNEEIYA